MEFDNLVLKPMSLKILTNLEGKPPRKAEAIGQEIGLTTRQVDAAITKTLVRQGLAIRKSQLSRLLKKEYSVIEITERGARYLNWLQRQQSNKGE